MKCSYCNQEHPEGTRFCPITGKEILIPGKCPQCGNSIDPNWLHCANCGRKLMKTGGMFKKEKSQSINNPQMAITKPELRKTAPDSRKASWLKIAGGIGLLSILAVIVFKPFWQGENIVVESTALVGRIAFVSNRDGNSEIYLMNADGTNQTRLTNNYGQINDDFPTWSPDGQKIAFVSTRDENAEIYVMNADGSHQIRLTNNQAGDYYPDWSTDGQKIAFISDRNGEFIICEMNADGSDQTCFPNSQLGSIHPDYGMDGDMIWMDNDMGILWSPDGQKIVYSSERSGNSKIYIMNTDGGDQILITDGWDDTNPDWSVDGQKIAFSGEYEVYVINADGSDRICLTNTDESDSRSPTWSPDGGEIAFQTNRDGNYEIYVMGANGSSPIRLTNNQEQDWNPAWAPVASPAVQVAAIPTSDTSSGAIGEMVEVPAGTFQMGC